MSKRDEKPEVSVINHGIITPKRALESQPLRYEPGQVFLDAWGMFELVKENWAGSWQIWNGNKRSKVTVGYLRSCLFLGDDMRFEGSIVGKDAQA